MATKKDLVEAYSYSRRRLVTAFVSGAPGGREVEPTKPGRTIIGGLAIGVLLVAGAAIASILSPTTPSDWKDVGLVISKEKGQPYVILEKSDNPVLRPVANIVSAQLILGADVEPQSLPQETIAEQTKAPAIGIIGAPDSLPTSQEFVETGWTACTGTGTGIAFDVSDDDAVAPAPGLAVLVDTPNPDTGKDVYYVIAQVADRTGELPRAYSYRVPDNDQADKMLDLLGLGATAEAQVVEEEWLDLFPSGGALDFDSFGIAQVGEPAPSAGVDGIPADAVVGDYVVVGDGEFAYVLTADGMAPLDPWSLTVYASSRLPGKGNGQPRAIPLPAVPGVDQQVLPFRGPNGVGGAHWPDSTMKGLVGEECAQLDTVAGQPPLVTLTQKPQGAASAVEVDDGDKRVTMAPGRGAYVEVGDWNDTSSLSRAVVDTTGAIYNLEGALTVSKLGYDTYDAPLVPDSWTKLFAQGVTLSSFQALCPPDLPGRTAGECAESP